MKRLVMLIALLSTCLFLLTGCKGSKAIQGTWQVTTGAEVSSEMILTEKTIEVDGEKHDYKQHAVGYVNGVQYYSIALDGDESEYFTILFPAKDKDVAFFILADDTDEPTKGKILYAMHRDEVPSYEEYVKKYGK